MYNLMAHALIGQLSNDLHGVRAEIQYVRKELLAMREESGANRGQQEALGSMSFRTSCDLSMKSSMQ